MRFTHHRYICQYIEVPQTSAGQAAKWLALQGLFAVIRVAIWIWNPAFDDFVMERAQPHGPGHHVSHSEAQLIMLWFTHVHPTKVRRVYRDLLRNTPRTKDEMDAWEKMRLQKTRPRNWYGWEPPADLQIPICVLPALDLSQSSITTAFEMAWRLRRGGQRGKRIWMTLLERNFSGTCLAGSSCSGLTLIPTKISLLSAQSISRIAVESYKRLTRITTLFLTGQLAKYTNAFQTVGMNLSKLDAIYPTTKFRSKSMAI